MYSSTPPKSPGSLQNPFPVIGKRCLPIRIKANRIFHHHYISLSIQSCLQLLHFFQIFLIHDIIRIQPHPVIRAYFFHEKIPCSRKIITPDKIKYLRRILFCNFFRSVRRTCIRNQNLIHDSRNRFQDPLQHSFFIFYDHTKTERTHI